MTSSGRNIAQSRSGQICVVVLTGRIDNSRAGQVQAQLNGLIGSGEKTILLDLAGVAYLTSAAFRVLLVAQPRRTQPRPAGAVQRHRTRAPAVRARRPARVLHDPRLA
jgi:hypothetical protein